jgi:hypothetical protein
MIRRAVHRRGLAVIALLASLATAVWVLQPPKVELGPGSTSGPAEIEYRHGTTTTMSASIQNDGAGTVHVHRVLPGDKRLDGLMRITGANLEPTRLEPGEEVTFELNAAFESCRGFAPGRSGTLMQFRVALDGGATAWVRLGQPVRVDAPDSCPDR